MNARPCLFSSLPRRLPSPRAARTLAVLAVSEMTRDQRLIFGPPIKKEGRRQNPTHPADDGEPLVLLLLRIPTRSRLLPRDNQVVIEQEHVQVRPPMPIPLRSVPTVNLSGKQHCSLVGSQVKVQIDSFASPEEELLTDLPCFDFGCRCVDSRFFEDVRTGGRKSARARTRFERYRSGRYTHELNVA